MEIRGIRDIQDITLDLEDRGFKLRDILADRDEFLETIMDEEQIVEYMRPLEAFEWLALPAESKMLKMLYDCEDMELNEELRERVVFSIQRHLNAYIKSELLGYIDVIISIREREFKDYRVRDWQLDVARKMEMIRDFYKQRYNLE